MSQQPLARVLYDAACPLCLNLAQLVERRAQGRFAVQSWQDYLLENPSLPALPADRLRVLAGDELLEGAAAWSWLLVSYPDMAGLGWLASRLGLAEPAARLLGGAATVLRRLCRNCGESILRRRLAPAGMAPILDFDQASLQGPLKSDEGEGEGK